MKRLIVSVAVLLAAAQAGHADFKAGLAAYERGDHAAALEEWLPIAERGDANAQYNVGLLFHRGEVIPQNIAAAARFYQMAAEQGVAAAQYNLGVIHANGQGVPQNLMEARHWLEKAAAQNVPEAADVLGYMYASGQGVKKDFARALEWYRSAAEYGLPGSQFNLGLMHDLGQGMGRNFEEALSWYRKAAEQGYGAAYCNIGILYYNAQGVKRDLVESYAWMSRCDKAGDPRGGQLVRVLEKRMKPQDIRRGQELAAAWQPSGPARREPDTERLFARQTTVAPTGSADRSAAPAGLEAPGASGIGTVATAPADVEAKPPLTGGPDCPD